MRANTEYKTATETPASVTALASSAIETRRVLLADLNSLISRGLLPESVLGSLQGVNGHKNIVVDIVTMADILKKNAEKIAERTSVKPDEIYAAENLADQLGTAIGLDDLGPGLDAPWHIANRPAAHVCEVSDSVLCAQTVSARRASCSEPNVSWSRHCLSNLVATLAGLLFTGCLTDSYAIRHDELVRIAELPPENRGSHVRVTQKTSFSDSYEEPDPLPPVDDEPSGAVVVVGTTHVHHDRYGEAGAPPPSRRQPAHLRSSGGGFSPGAGGTSASSSASKGSDADAAVAIAIAALAVTTGAFSITALTEGPRFDGWVWIPPGQQILLKPRTAAPYWMPLADLTPRDAVFAEDAELKPTDAQLLERAPLNRVGMTTSLEFGGSAMRTTSIGGPSGFMVRYAVGGFPVQWLGLLGNAGFSAGDDYGSLFEGRLGLELRLMPLHVGRVHLGSYGELGHAWLLHDITGGTAHGEGTYYGAGGLLEIDLTTRLGLLLRGGAAWLPRYDSQQPGPDVRLPFPEFSIGLSVY